MTDDDENDDDDDYDEAQEEENGARYHDLWCHARENMKTVPSLENSHETNHNCFSF